MNILVGGCWHNSGVSIQDIDVPMDEHNVFNFHCYEPLVFTHHGAAWSHRQMDFDLSDPRMDGVREELLPCL